MNRIRLFHSAALALALASATQGGMALAQTEIVQPTNSDADALADQMRALASNPRDINALLSAGELSARLNDTSAALAFFARAEVVEPSNPRILAGRASALVRTERPGEALQLFQAAEAGEFAPVNYASDRGFAYDLLGAPQLAQRDYELALERDTDDETVRRYALSLGITGKPEEAMAHLDILLRKGDRASWRARAFVLAMNGDVAGAERIASTMMPASMGAGLTPFFRRLGGMSVADRAFAVHFGALSPTQARLADAQLAPPLPAYVPQPRPVEVAVAPPPPPAAAAPARGNARRSSRSRRGEELAPPAGPVPIPVPAPVQLAAANPLPPPPAYIPPPPAPIVQSLPTPAPTPSQRTSRPVQFTARPATAPEEIPAPSRSAPGNLASAAERNYGLREASPAIPPPERPRPAARPPASARIGQEDSVLASIVRGITIPPSEIEAVSVPREVAAAPLAPAPKPVRVAEAVAKPAKPAASAPAKPAAAKGKAPAKPEPRKPDPKKLDPSRVWVQVAGGANEQTLPKTWQNLVKQAPTAFKGRSAWTTPLRATNRLLVGPFKTSGEAQGFVNQLKKADMSGFVFTSEAGQKITKLGAK